MDCHVFQFDSTAMNFQFLPFVVVLWHLLNDRFYVLDVVVFVMLIAQNIPPLLYGILHCCYHQSRHSVDYCEDEMGQH